MSQHENRARNTPMGAIVTPEGVHFALYAPGKERLTLVICSDEGGANPREILLCASDHLNEAGVWTTIVEDLPPTIWYGYNIDGQWVVDPYAKALSTPQNWGGARGQIFGKVEQSEPFSWEGVNKPGHSLQDLFIYEMHVRGFTQDPTSQSPDPGTFKGVIEKIPHLIDLGVNAVELMPVYSFDEKANPETGLGNYWGYSSESFFALMNPFGTQRDFQEMVKALHKAGIEVILDVVYNHVGCGWFDTLSRSSYFVTYEGEHTNYTGCGNTVNTNHPITKELILDSLRYFANEMQVDGFRFDLASIFCRDHHGTPIEHPPIIEAMCRDPELSSVKLIAEPWDCGGLYQVGTFPGNGRFAQWNGQFRDSVRRFVKGSDGAAGPFAAAIAGSSTFQSINFITAHDGFTLRDLVTYNEKHNEANGEEGRDGSDWNESWNCGAEGPSVDPAISELRERQMKNLVMALSFSFGTPMMLMGDEYGHTKKGNNNTYCQDNSLNYFDWQALKTSPPIFEFFKQCIALRKSCPIFHEKHFLEESDVEWLHPDWSPGSRFVGCILKGTEQDLILAFNTSDAPFELNLPSTRFGSWTKVVDTALSEQKSLEAEKVISMRPRSGVLILS